MLHALDFARRAFSPGKSKPQRLIQVFCRASSFVRVAPYAPGNSGGRVASGGRRWRVKRPWTTMIGVCMATPRGFVVRSAACVRSAVALLRAVAPSRCARSASLTSRVCPIGVSEV